jgi:hypothetical protein
VLRRFSEYHDLEGAFGRRSVTERAKGILMERHSGVGGSRRAHECHGREGRDRPTSPAQTESDLRSTGRKCGLGQPVGLAAGRPSPGPALALRATRAEAGKNRRASRPSSLSQRGQWSIVETAAALYTVSLHSGQWRYGMGTFRRKRTAAAPRSVSPSPLRGVAPLSLIATVRPASGVSVRLE